MDTPAGRFLDELIELYEKYALCSDLKTITYIEAVGCIECLKDHVLAACGDDTDDSTNAGSQRSATEKRTAEISR